jgi:hypothetical protein
LSAESVRLVWERMEARDWKGVAVQLHPDVVVVSDGKIVRGVEYWSDGEPSPAPEWRAQWTEPL